MFTGIIEEVGKIVSIDQRDENRRITFLQFPGTDGFVQRDRNRRRRRVAPAANGGEYDSFSRGEVAQWLIEAGLIFGEFRSFGHREEAGEKWIA